MKIYTKSGDDGTTGLFGGKRVSKASLRVETYGSVDEINATIGIAASSCPSEELLSDLRYVSSMLFSLGSDLAMPINPAPKFEIVRINADNINWLEKKIDSYDVKLDPLKNFILPGGSACSAQLHFSRTVCRRAERLAVALSIEEDLGDYAVKFLNRLSDYLFTAARLANKIEGIEDIKWNRK
jgi:cob(I)alamin adenosyltransferase